MNYNNFILEHKFWGKTISEFLDWIDKKSDKYFILIDTETTGLPSDPYTIQLTQVSCLVVKYDFTNNTFSELDKFNKKIKLTDETKDIIKNNKKSEIKKILSFNHYGEKTKFSDESETLKDFFDFISKYDSIFVIQNAEFDMRFLNTRSKGVSFKNEVIDTKQIAQLFYLPLLQKLAEDSKEYKDIITKIGTSDRDNGLISSSLSKLGPAMGINMKGYHDALIDCRLMMEMFLNMIKLLKNNIDVDISKYQLERIQTKK